MSEQHMQRERSDTTIEVGTTARNQGKTIASLNMNRKQRRNFAKKYKLFQDPSREAWRIGNKHMKGDKQNKETEHKLGAE